jgi:hypothetical protein
MTGHIVKARLKMKVEKKRRRAEKKGKRTEKTEERVGESPCHHQKAGSLLASATTAAFIRALKLKVELIGVAKRKNVALEHFLRSINTLWL